MSVFVTKHVFYVKKLVNKCVIEKMCWFLFGVNVSMS